MRICVFAERLAPPFDEGIKNYTRQLVGQFGRDNELLALTCFGQDIPLLGIENVPGNQLLLSPILRNRIRRFAPDLVIYVPTACATLFSFARSRVLKAYANGAPVVMIALQVRQYGRMARTFMPCLCPDLVMVQSALTQRSLVHLCSSLVRMPPAVDLERFRPADTQARMAIRERYGLPLDRRILLHVGHLNQGRNVQSLIDLQGVNGQQVVIVGSSSTPHDAGLVDDLRHHDVYVIDYFVDDISDLYRAADCYLFPVQNETSAIDMPLSVLEAMACNLPVIATRFGALEILADVQGVYLQDDLCAFQQAVDRCYDQPVENRQWIERFGWKRVIGDLMRHSHDLIRTSEES